MLTLSTTTTTTNTTHLKKIPNHQKKKTDTEQEEAPNTIPFLWRLARSTTARLRAFTYTGGHR